MENQFLRSESSPEGQAKYQNNIPPTTFNKHLFDAQKTLKSLSIVEGQIPGVDVVIVHPMQAGDGCPLEPRICQLHPIPVPCILSPF